MLIRRNVICNFDVFGGEGFRILQTENEFDKKKEAKIKRNIII